MDKMLAYIALMKSVYAAMLQANVTKRNINDLFHPHKIRQKNNQNT